MGSLFYYGVFISDLVVLTFVTTLLVKKTKSPVVVLCGLHSLLNSLSITFGVLYPRQYTYNLAIFTISEYLIFSSLVLLFVSTEKWRRIIKIASPIFLLFVAVLFFSSGKNKIDSIAIGIETILVFVFAFSYFHEEMNDISGTFVYNKHSFWIISGILLYLGGSFFMYVFANQVERSFLEQFWFLTYIFYIIKSIFFLIGLVLFFRQQKVENVSEFRPTFN